MIGIFELFKVGIGPSSSHTVGPMKASAHFVEPIKLAGLMPRVSRVRVDVYGSLAWTGKGHGTDKAVIVGLAGEIPETVDPDDADRIVALARRERSLRLPWDPRSSLIRRRMLSSMASRLQTDTRIRWD